MRSDVTPTPSKRAGRPRAARPDWQVAYAYDRWRPTLFANVADDTDPWRGGEVRTREANAGVLFPFRRVRWSQSLLGALHSSVDELTCGDTGNGPQATCEGGDTVRVARRALRGGWLLNDSQILRLLHQPRGRLERDRHHRVHARSARSRRRWRGGDPRCARLPARLAAPRGDRRTGRGCGGLG